MEKGERKGPLRKKYKAFRKTLSKDTIEDASLSIANKVVSLDIWDKKVYHLFLPIEHQKEINTEYILNILQGKDKEVVISKSDFNTGEMIHYLLTDSTRLECNSYGIPEPQSGIEIKPDLIDVVFVPLLAYDKKGNRLGYGKGFYDRFLAKCRQDVLKIGLSCFEPEIDEIPINTTDVKLNCCVSAKKIFYF